MERKAYGGWISRLEGGLRSVPECPVAAEYEREYRDCQEDQRQKPVIGDIRQLEKADESDFVDG